MNIQAIPTDSSFMSLKNYGAYDFPVQFYIDDFKNMPLGHINWHWHRQIEFSYVLSGEMDCSVSDIKTRLKQGEAVFINSERMHMSEPATESVETLALSVVFSPAILSYGVESTVYQKYISPVVFDKYFPCMVLKKNIQWQYEILKYLSELYKLYQKQSYGFELLVQALLVKIWLTLVLNLDRKVQGSSAELVMEERIKHMVTYIQSVFSETITLEQIAASANVSKSECIRCFKSRLGMTPIEYVIELRISKAMSLLSSTALSVSEIGQICGFESASYFTKIFKRSLGVTPSDYRKRLNK